MRNIALKAYTWAQARQSHEEGQTVIEYALVTAAISIVLIGLLFTFGNGVIDDAQAQVDAFLFP